MTSIRRGWIRRPEPWDCGQRSTIPTAELLPGLFVSLRVPAADAVESLLIPERAVLRDQEGTYVLIVDAENEVDRARIDLGQAVSGWAIVLGGIDTSTRVLVEGLQFARPGGTVVPKEAEFEVDANELLRGLSDPDRSELPSNGADSTAGNDPESSGRVEPDARSLRIASHRMSRFFIYRPIFASVISIVIVIAGLVSQGRCRSQSSPRSRRPPSRFRRSIPAPMPRPSPKRSPPRSSNRSTASKACSTCRRNQPTMGPTT